MTLATPVSPWIKHCGSLNLYQLLFYSSTSIYPESFRTFLWVILKKWWKGGGSVEDDFYWKAKAIGFSIVCQGTKLSEYMQDKENENNKNNLLKNEYRFTRSKKKLNFCKFIIRKIILLIYLLIISIVFG